MQREIGLDLLKKIEPVVVSTTNENHVVYNVLKRIADFSFSLLALIFLSPLVAVVSLLIKLDSPGPVFFTQDRVILKRKSRNREIYWQKTTFRCYKFRTMVCNADPSLHKAYIQALIENNCESMADLQGEETEVRKLVHDPRVTRLGRFLRKYSIDEVPQFINVLKGEMSVVGPRPAIPYEVDMYKPWHYRRLETKPGITGLWQVTARSSADFDEMVNLDIQYIDQQSLLLDLKIVLKTPLVVLSTIGAL